MSDAASDLIEDMRRAAYDCADMYMMDVDLPSSAPPEVAEAIWDQFIGDVKTGVRTMFQNWGAEAETVALAEEVVVRMVFERLDQHAAMPEAGHA